MSTRLKELWCREPLGPWRGKVTIAAMTGHKMGRLTSLPFETLFRVTAEWTGPPAVWSANKGARVAAQDTVICRSYSAAQRTAREAADLLRNGQVPDLRKLAGGGSVSAARAFL